MADIAAIILRDRSGRYYVHQRASTKQLYPDLFGLGAGGRIEVGEKPEIAAMRELKEETAIVAEPRALFALDFEDSSVSHRIHVFETISDCDPLITHQEWQWSGWLSQADVDRLSDQRRLCPDTLLFYKKYRAGENN